MKQTESISEKMRAADYYEISKMNYKCAPICGNIQEKQGDSKGGFCRKSNERWTRLCKNSLNKYEVNDQKYNMNHHRIPELKEGKWVV